jgi:hypothetical protein
MGSVSVLSAGAYIATLTVMENIVKVGGRAPPTLPAWENFVKLNLDVNKIMYTFNFSVMVECTPESGRCHCVCVLLVPAQRFLLRLAILPFIRLFGGEGKFEYTGCDTTEHRGQRLEQRP